MDWIKGEHEAREEEQKRIKAQKELDSHRHVRLQREVLRRIFLEVDVDGSGGLSESELERVVLKLFDELPEIVNNSLFKKNINMDILCQHIETAEDAEYLRNKLEEMRLVAFIADGAILPRESGISDRPMNKESVVSFRPPESSGRGRAIGRR